MTIWNYLAVFGHIHIKTRAKCMQTSLLGRCCGSAKFGWIFPALYKVWERTNTPWLCSLLGECWWRYWIGVKTAVYYVLRYWFRLMWLTTVSSCAKWPHQTLPGRRFWPKLRKQRPVSDFQYGRCFFTNRIKGKLIFLNLFCWY